MGCLTNIALSINTDFFIAPGVSKTYAVESNLLATPNGNATINQSIPFTAFKQSCLYQRFSGFATIDAGLDAGLLSYVVLPPRVWIWRSPSGVEMQIIPVSFSSESWRQSPDPESPPILRWLKGTEGEQINSALTQKLNWTVNSRTGVDYTQDTNDKIKKVKTYALNLPATVTNAVVVDAR